MSVTTLDAGPAPAGGEGGFSLYRLAGAARELVGSFEKIADAKSAVEEDGGEATYWIERAEAGGGLTTWVFNPAQKSWVNKT